MLISYLLVPLLVKMMLVGNGQADTGLLPPVGGAQGGFVNKVVPSIEREGVELHPVLSKIPLFDQMSLNLIYVNFPTCFVASSDGTLTGEAEELKCRVTEPLNLSGLSFHA